MTSTITTQAPIVVDIDIDAPVARVWQAWTDPQQRVEWWGDDSMYRTTRMTSDLRVGGEWLVEGRGVDGKSFTVRGRYTRVDAPHALGFTWLPDYAPGLPETQVLVELVPTSRGTHVTVTHEGFPPGPAYDSHRTGWHRVLGWLDRYVVRR